jgi:TRAP-type mannitol/chloroaromatic compound transport system permease small subunit
VRGNKSSIGQRDPDHGAEGRFDRLTSVMNSVGTGWVFVLLLLINSDILGRAVFNAPIRGVPEIVSLSIVACVFLQLAHTLKVGRLTRSEMLLNWLGDRAPGLRSFLEGLYHFIGGVLMLVILNASYPFFIKAWKINEYVGAEGDFMAPVWPVKLIILCGCLVAALQFFIETWKQWRRMGGEGD